MEEQRLHDIIYVTASDSPLPLTPAQTEQTQFIAPPTTPLPTRSTNVAPITSAAGAGTPRDSSILPGGRLTAPSTTSARTSPVPKLPSDVLSPSDRFILDEVIRHVQSTHPSLLPQPDLSQPIVWDGYHYKRISPISVLSLSNHFYVMLNVLSATLRRILSSASRELTSSLQLIPHLSLLIVIGSTISAHIRRLQHISPIMNTNPVIRFWKIPTTFLLLLFLRLNVVPTKSTPLRHVEFRTG